MGMNYYAVKNRPTIREPIHIGKSSMGWLFCFQDQNDKYADVPIEWHTYNQVKNWLKEHVIEKQDYVIMNEDDEIISFEDLFKKIDEKQKDEKCLSNPDNFNHCKNVDGYRFSDNDFS